MEDPSQVVGKSILNLIHPNSHLMVETRLKKLSEEEQVLPLVEQKHIRLNQEEFDAEVITSSIFFAGTYVAQTIVRDITRRKSEEEILKHRATHDPLTNLPNRFLFQDRLQHAIAKSHRQKMPGAVLYMDLDNFKSINDAFGHAAGDEVLQAVALSLVSSLREGDTVARIGGDEFVVLLDEIRRPMDAEHVAQNIISAVSRTLTVGDKEVIVSMSVGISIFPDDGTDVHTLLQLADAAMYSAKVEGKHRFKYFASYMREQSLERLDMQAQLNHALELEQFFIQYQPQVDCTTGKIIGVEALLRWRHPELGLVSPGKFIPLAEESGLIIPIGRWVLNTVCQQIRKWSDAGIRLRAAVNFSNLQLRQPDTVKMVQEAIEHAGISSELLEIELTENIVFQTAGSSFDELLGLKSTGIVLSMDDFGAGFSTLGYLAQLPFDRIKIDQRLVANIRDPREAAIVSGVIAICKSLNLELIAEGVETLEQLDFCTSRGCTLFQGWYYSPAVDPLKIEQYVLHGIPFEE